MVEQFNGDMKESSPQLSETSSVDAKANDNDDSQKRHEEDERQQREDEEQKLWFSQALDEIRSRIEMRKELRSKNLNRECPDESFFVKLDSSIKKVPAFIKKLRNLTESQREPLAKEMSTLNLSKYISEVASAVTEAKLKMSDIPCALHLCTLLHQRYADFSASLLEAWQKLLNLKRDSKVANPSKMRVDIRFFAELILIGILPDKEALSLLGNQLMVLINFDKDEHNNLPIVQSFCKHCGDEFAGFVPRRVRELALKYGGGAPVPQSGAYSADKQRGCRQLLKDYYSSLVEHVVREHHNLRQMELSNRKLLQKCGELPDARKDELEQAQSQFQKLHANTAAFADLVDELMPELPVYNEPDDELETGLMNVDIFQPGRDEGALSDLWEDEETRSFYEHIPDLKAIIPQIMYQDSVKEIEKRLEESKKSEEQLDEDQNLNVDDVEKELEQAAVDPSVDEQVEPAVVEAVEDEDVSGSTMKQLMETFVHALPQSINTDLIDRAAQDFCMNLNTKTNRRKLIQALFQVPRTRLDLLPLYARLAAELQPILPQVCADLIEYLKKDLRYHIRKKDQILIESKIKTVRFIGELVKFAVFARVDALNCLKTLLYDFRHHNIDMACHLLETCGRYLYRSVDSHRRMKIYLEVMMRKKTAFAMDTRYTSMIDNAFYQCNPPESASKNAKKTAREHCDPRCAYLHKLLYKDLTKMNVEKIGAKLRKFDWSSEDTKCYVIHCLSQVWNIRFNLIHCVASLVSFLATYYEDVAVQIIDNALEDVRLGLETNHPKFNQRRTCVIKFIGELYSYKLVESTLVFQILYSMITFAVSLDPEQVSELDPPEHLFRIRLVCILLDTCGRYFIRGNSKKKLDCFLTYFQRYFHFKKESLTWNDDFPFPIDVEHTVKECLERLRPSFKWAACYADAVKAVENLEQELRPQVERALPRFGDAEDWASDDGLMPIAEMDAEMSQLSNDMSPEYEEEMSQDAREETRSEEEEGGDDMSGLSQEAGQVAPDEDVAVVVAPNKHVDTPEDSHFLLALDQLMSDSLAQRQAVKVPPADIAIPVHPKAAVRVNFAVNGDGFVSGDIPEAKKANFFLMMKKGNRAHLHSIDVPSDSPMALRLRAREEAEKAEKEKLKKLTLDINDRLEAEEMQELRQEMMSKFESRDRDRGGGGGGGGAKPRYNHPKGAPDADLIFGKR